MKILSENTKAEEVVLSEEAEAGLYQIAENLGVLVNRETADALVTFLRETAAAGIEPITESTRRDSASRLASLVDHSAHSTRSGCRKSLPKRRASVSSPGVERRVCHWWMFPGITATKNAAVAQPMRRRSFGSASSPAASAPFISGPRPPRLPRR